MNNVIVDLTHEKDPEGFFVQVCQDSLDYPGSSTVEKLHHLESVDILVNH